MVMLLDEESDIHVPVAFILIEKTSQRSYWHALHLLVVASVAKICPSKTTTDFEKALFGAVENSFPKRI